MNYSRRKYLIKNFIRLRINYRYVIITNLDLMANNNIYIFKLIVGLVLILCGTILIVRDYNYIIF